MNYDKEVCSMLEHAKTPEQIVELTLCISFAMAHCAANAKTLSDIKCFLDETFNAIRLEATKTYLEINGLTPEELIKCVVTVGPMQ